VRKLFAQCKIPFRSVDIDSPELQQGGLGGRIRAAVTVRTGSPTIPQLLIGGQFVGGAVEVLDAFAQRGLQKLLVEHRVSFDQSVQLDPYTLLPGWCVATPRGEG
jgi:cysteine synthase A